MISEKKLMEIIPDNMVIRMIEPHIYSLARRKMDPGYEETRMEQIYNLVSCSRLFNRVIFGYNISEYYKYLINILKRSDGWILDAGCGALSFSAESYIEETSRPLVLLDPSIENLKAAREKIIRLLGDIPSNMIFIHADTRDLPFRDGSFDTVISISFIQSCMNPVPVLKEMKRVAKKNGDMIFTSLVANKRPGDLVLNFLGEKEKLVSRNLKQVEALFRETGLKPVYETRGNLVFVECHP